MGRGQNQRCSWLLIADDAWHRAVPCSGIQRTIRVGRRIQKQIHGTCLETAAWQPWPALPSVRGGDVAAGQA
jgi:hypothetical protein